MGIDTDKILEFTEVVAALGETTSMSAETAAEEFARLANITGMSQDDFDKLGSAIVELGNNFATSESEISTMSLRLAAAGSQIGLSEADILGLAATLSSLGIEAEAGGSAISKIMVNMQLAASTGLEPMRELETATGLTRRELELMASNNSGDFKSLADAMGMTTAEMQDIMGASKNLENFAEIAGMSGEEFQKAFGEDAIGAMMAFIDGLGGIDTESESAIEKLDAMGISEVRLRDALLRLAGNSDLVTEAVASSNVAWEENTALQEEAALRYGTVQSQLDILKNKLTNVAITAGQELLPTIIDLVDMAEPLIKRLGDAAEAFGKLDDKTKQNIIGFGGFLIAGGPILKMVAGIVTNTGKLTSTLGKGAEMLFKTGKAATAAGEGTKILGLGLGGLKTLLVGGVIVGGFAALAYGINEWDKAQKESIDQSERWGDSLDEKTKDALTDVQNFNLDATQQLTLFNDGLYDSSENVIDAYGNIVDTISSEGQRAVSELDETFKYLPEELQKTLQYSIGQRKTELNELVSEAGTSEERITEIMRLAASERRELTAGEMAEVEALQKRLIEIQAEIATQNGEVQDGIYEGMFTKITTMNKEQLKQHDQFITDRRNLEKEGFDKRQQALDEALASDMVSEEQYNEHIAELDEERTEAKNKHYSEVYQIQKAAGVSYDELLETQTASGLSFAELDEIHNERIRESRKGVIEITEEMTEEQVKAARIWNGLILNPITGEVTTNTEEAIIQAVNDEEQWNDMLFLLHDANVASNIKNQIKEAMIANGTWNDLNYTEKQAIVETNAKTTTKEFLEASGQWEELPWETKNAILDTNSPEQLVQILKDFGLWDSLDPTIQEFLATTNATEKATEAEKAVGQFNKLHPTTHKLEVTTNAWSAVSTYNQAMASVRGKTVAINVSLNRTSMDSAISGIQAIGYAKGTDYHKGGLAILGDGGRREPFLTPDGRMGVSPDQDTMYALPRGTKVWSSIEKFRREANQKNILKPLIKHLPHFAEGTEKSFLNSVSNNERTIASDTYNFYLSSEVSDKTIDKIYTKFEQKAKNKNDRRKSSIGEVVRY